MIRITCILSFLLCLSAEAQTGFLGKPHLISFDTYGAIFNNRYDIVYHYSASNNFQWHLEYRYTGLFDKPCDKDAINITESANYPDIQAHNLEGTLRYTANTIGIGYILSSKFTGMPMPFGYYEGLAYEYTWGHLTENYIIPKDDVMTSTGNATNNYNLQIPFTNTSHTIKAMMGKNSYLGKNFSLDLGLEFGLTWGHITPDDNELEKIPPANFHVNQNFIVDIAELITGKSALAGDFDNYINTDTHLYLRFHFTPKVKICYLF